MAVSPVYMSKIIRFLLSVFILPFAAIGLIPLYFAYTELPFNLVGRVPVTVMRVEECRRVSYGDERYQGLATFLVKQKQFAWVQPTVRAPGVPDTAFASTCDAFAPGADVDMLLIKGVQFGELVPRGADRPFYFWRYVLISLPFVVCALLSLYLFVTLFRRAR